MSLLSLDYTSVYKDVISLDDIKRWPHLHNIDLNVMDCEVGLLIGVNVTKEGNGALGCYS